FNSFAMAKSKVRIGESKKFVKPTEPPKVSHALEDYLKTIYQLAEESQPVIAARIAVETGVSPSTIFYDLAAAGARRLRDHQRPQGNPSHFRRQNGGRENRAAAFFDRALSHRSPRARLGEGASGGAPAGARDLAGRGRTAGDLAQQSHHLSARQSDSRRAC